METARGFLPYGTAVIGLVEFQELGNTVLVTAQHVLEQIPGENVSVRLTRNDGKSEVRKIPKAHAITFKDRAIDLAVLPDGLDPSIYDIRPFSLDRTKWLAAFKAFGHPCQGDEICVVGLYTSHYGHARNMPVVRIGHLAALPEEKVMTDRGYVHAYLIECHSIAGLSGSPVYLTVPQMRMHNGELQYAKEGYYIPLGILLGHHVVAGTQDDLVVPQFQQAPEDREEDKEPDEPDMRRTGFAVVLPINHVFEIFESEQMKKILREGADEVRAKSGFRPASAAAPVELDSPSKDENPQHREDFTALLSAAARKPKQGG
jgi:hypothetical protein